MIKLNGLDIERIVELLSLKNESLKDDFFIGKNKDKKAIIKNGLKIKHTPSGLVYTVEKVSIDKFKNPFIVCSRPGKRILITSDKFNEYERQ